MVLWDTFQLYKSFWKGLFCDIILKTLISGCEFAILVFPLDLFFMCFNLSTLFGCITFQVGLPVGVWCVLNRSVLAVCTCTNNITVNMMLQRNIVKNQLWTQCTHWLIYFTCLLLMTLWTMTAVDMLLPLSTFLKIPLSLATYKSSASLHHTVYMPRVATWSINACIIIIDELYSYTLYTIISCYVVHIVSHQRSVMALYVHI